MKKEITTKAQEDMIQKQGYYAEGVEKLRPLLPQEFIDTVKGHLKYSTFIRKRKNSKNEQNANDKKTGEL
jgi:hypothetical protein